uniref:Amastin n=1 Tax=Trypanosoma congolense (strain IL3000) TaxID=1068625 RepID=G0USQ4_TRYCI|nr:conserved hypothetical protein [Trypanosoma congolense IL3000]
MRSIAARATRIVVMTFAVASLVLSLLTLFLPVFETKGEAGGLVTLWMYRLKSAAGAPNNESSDQHDDETDVAASNSGMCDGAAGNSSHSVLYQNYFTCDYGNFHIQVMEGMSIVATVLNFTNFVMSAFFLSSRNFLRGPLVTYFLLASFSTAVVFVILTDWYNTSWCTAQPCLKCMDGVEWRYGLGWILLVASFISSVAGALVAFIAF